MAIKSFAEFQAEQKAGTQAPTQSAPSLPAGVKSFADFQAERKSAKTAKPNTSAPTPSAPTTSAEKPTVTAAGPRISLLQKSQQPQQVIRPATQDEIKQMNDPAVQERNRIIASSTPEAKQQEAANNAPTELHGFVTKTLPSIRNLGTSWIENADKMAERTGLSPEGTRAAGAVLQKSADILQDFTSKAGAVFKSNSKSELARNVINAGVATVNLGAIPFIAAIEGAGTIPVAGKVIKPAIEKPMEIVQKAGSYALESTYKGYYNAFTGSMPSNEDPNIVTAQELGGLIGIMAGMKALHSAAKTGSSAFAREIRSGDPAYAASTALGLGTPEVGKPFEFTPEQVDSAYKKSVAQVSSSGENVQQHVDALTVAHKILMDKVSGNVAGDARWQQVAQGVERMMPEVMSQSQSAIQEMASATDAAAAKEARSQPMSGRTNVYRRLSENGKLTYEAEFENNFSKATDTAASKGVQVKVTDHPFDSTPGTFDPQTGEIVLNKTAVKDLIDRAERGERILIGSDKQAYVLEKLAGESRDALEKRIISDIIAHEKAHADTISPQDAAALQSAIETGDKIAYDKKMQELENKANAIRSVRGVEEPGVIDAAAKEVDRVQSILNAREQLKAQSYEAKYQSPELESGYAKFRNLAKNNPDILSYDLEGLQKRLETRPQYRGKSIERELGFDTVTHNDSRFPSGTTNDSLLTMFKDRFNKEAKLKEVARQKIQEMLPDKNKTSDVAARAVRSEVKRILAEEKASERALAEKNKRMSQFNDIVTSKEAISTGKEGEVRKLAAQENKYRSDLEAQKSILESSALLDRAVLRMQKESVIRKLRDEKISDVEARGAIVSYIKDNIPAELRGTVAKDFMTRIKNATSRTDLEKTFREIDQSYNRAKRANLKKKIVASLKETVLKRVNGVTQAKFGKSQPALDAIREGALKGSRSEAFNKIIENVKNAKRDAEGNLPDDVVKQNQILQTFGVKEQTVSQLERTLATIEELKTHGKTEMESEAAQRKMRRERIVETARKTLTGGKEIDTGIVGIERDGGNKFVQTVKDHFNFKSAPLDFIMNLLSRNDKESAPFDSPLNRMANRAAKARYEATALDYSMEEARLKMVEDAYGKKGFKLAREWRDINTKRENVGTFTDADGKSIDLKLTRAEKMNIYAESRNASTRVEILDRNRFTPEMLDAIEKSLKPEDKKFADSQFEYYAKHYQAFADTFYKDTGAMLPKSENYIPRWAEGVAKEDVTFASMLADDAIHRMSLRPGSSRARSGGGAIKFSYDPLAKMRDYSTQVNHYVSTMEAVKDMKAVFTNEDIRGIIRAQHGDVALKMIDHHLDLMTRGGVDGRLVNRALSALSSRITRAFINTPSVVIGQPSSNAQFLAASDSVGQFGVGLADFVRNPKRATELMSQYSLEFRQRYEKGSGHHIEEAKVQSTAAQLSGASKIMDIAEMPLEAADYLGIAPGGWAIFREKFNQAKAKGFSESRAYEIAGSYLDKVIRTTQSTSSYTGKSYYETSGSLNKMLSMLQNQPNKVFQVVYHALGDAAAGKLPPAKAAKIVATYTVVLPVLYTAMKRTGSSVGQGIADAVAGTSEADKKKRDAGKDSFGAQALQEVAAQPFTSSIITGNFVKSALEWAQGKSYGYRPGVAFSLVDTIQQGVTKVGSGDIDSAILYGLKALSMERGVPYSQQILQAAISKTNKQNSADKKEKAKLPENKIKAKAAARERKFAK